MMVGICLSGSWVRAPVMSHIDHAVIIHHFVLLERWSLLQARPGMEAVEVFQRDYQPLLTAKLVTESLLSRGIARCLGAKRRDPSTAHLKRGPEFA